MTLKHHWRASERSQLACNFKDKGCMLTNCRAGVSRRPVIPKQLEDRFSAGDKIA
jgi:hypothetical protein